MLCVVTSFSVRAMALPCSPTSIQDVASCAAEIGRRGRWVAFLRREHFSVSTLRREMLQILCFSKDLMLPGVVVPSCGLPDVNRGDVCAVTLVRNRYASEKKRNLFPIFLKHRSLTALSWLIAGHLLQLAKLQCPRQRCTMWVWKGEEWVFSTLTWITSG